MNSRQKKLDLAADIPLDKVEGALLGAAIGDALGWPQERPNLRLDSNRSLGSSNAKVAFQRWRRRSGGRFAPHKENIEAGEYSDDTQLLLSVARSILTGASWTDVFALQELPVWLLYERGGGGALKRAARMWMKGKLPWETKDRRTRGPVRYFDAGGNGVAMRILPHSLLSDQSKRSLFTDIMANGVCTHGHPRALIGALLYGRAARTALQTGTTLEYGELVETLLRTENELREVPVGNPFLENWWKTAKDHSDGGYTDLWDSVVDEVVTALEICNGAMGKGALAIDRQVLTELGCYDRSVQGAGTVTAAAAIYLASRYAANPVAGVLEIAFAKGTDTDTISSMLGGLLGALHGTEWLRSEWNGLQDRSYISHLANRLGHTSESSLEDERRHLEPWTKKMNDGILEALMAEADGGVDLGPLGNADVASRFRLEMLTDAYTARSWKLRTAKGQTLYIRKLSRVHRPPETPTKTPRKGFAAKGKSDLVPLIATFIISLSDCFSKETSARDAFALLRSLFDLLLLEQAKYGDGEFLARFQDEKHIRELLDRQPIVMAGGVSKEDIAYVVRLVSKFLYDVAKES